jgi:hypothetical protein
MDVQIDELTSTVEVVDREALLSPELLARIVAAVRASLAAERRLERDRAQDVDVRSVVEQQRAGRR